MLEVEFCGIKYKNILVFKRRLTWRPSPLPALRQRGYKRGESGDSLEEVPTSLFEAFVDSFGHHQPGRIFRHLRRSVKISEIYSESITVNDITVNHVAVNQGGWQFNRLWPLSWPLFGPLLGPTELGTELQ